jgi:hypothetical protein
MIGYQDSYETRRSSHLKIEENQIKQTENEWDSLPKRQIEALATDSRVRLLLNEGEIYYRIL